MAHLKYSFDIEEGFSNFISIQPYGSPYTLPDLVQHESSYNLLNQLMGSWGEIFAPSTLQENYSSQDHLLALDSM